jgi:hypothetical protein
VHRFWICFTCVLGAGMTAVAIPRKMAHRGTFENSKAKFTGYGPGECTWRRLKSLIPTQPKWVINVSLRHLDYCSDQLNCNIHVLSVSITLLKIGIQSTTLLPTLRHAPLFCRVPRLHIENALDHRSGSAILLVLVVNVLGAFKFLLQLCICLSNLSNHKSRA